MSGAFSFCKDLSLIIPGQMSMRAAAILLHLQSAPGGQDTSKALSDSASMSAPSMTRAIDTLASMGYVRRLPRYGGRNLLVQITDNGRRIASEIETAFAEALPPTPAQRGKVAA